MSIPNTDFSTAIVIPSLPFHITTSAFEGGVAKSLWYAYTAVEGDEAVGSFGYGTPAPYAPYVDAVPKGVDGEPDWDFSISGNRNRPIQIAVEVGKTYFFSFDAFGIGSVTSADLIIDIIRHTPVSYSAGSIMIPDDTSGLPGTILSPTTGEVLKFIPLFAAGEVGDSAIINGKILTEDYNTNSFKLYNNQFNLLNTFFYTSWGLPSGTARGVTTAQATGNFYAGVEDTDIDSITIRRILPSGVLDSITWIMTYRALQCLAINNSETILYAVVQHIVAPVYAVIIAKWDLINNIALAEWIPTASGNIIEVHILENDHIVVIFVNFTGSSTYTTTVNEYDSFQILLHTYTFTTFRAPRAKIIPGDSSSIWIWFISAVGGDTSTFIKLRLSDGVHLQEFSHVQFEEGAYSETVTATPTDRFGHSNSCPIFLVYPPPPPVIPDLDGIYYITPTKTHDTYYNKLGTSVGDDGTLDPTGINKKIPNPTVRTTPIGS